MAERFTNARVNEHLTSHLNPVAEELHATRMMKNSAALDWFLEKLMAEERAEVLGEYVRVLAMQEPAERPKKRT